MTTSQNTSTKKVTYTSNLECSRAAHSISEQDSLIQDLRAQNESRNNLYTVCIFTA